LSSCELQVTETDCPRAKLCCGRGCRLFVQAQLCGRRSAAPIMSLRRAVAAKATAGWLPQCLCLERAPSDDGGTALVGYGHDGALVKVHKRRRNQGRQSLCGHLQRRPLLEKRARWRPISLRGRAREMKETGARRSTTAILCCFCLSLVAHATPFKSRGSPSRRGDALDWTTVEASTFRATVDVVPSCKRPRLLWLRPCTAVATASNGHWEVATGPKRLSQPLSAMEASVCKQMHIPKSHQGRQERCARILW